MSSERTLFSMFYAAFRLSSAEFADEMPILLLEADGYSVQRTEKSCLLPSPVTSETSAALSAWNGLTTSLPAYSFGIEVFQILLDQANYLEPFRRHPRPSALLHSHFTKKPVKPPAAVNHCLKESYTWRIYLPRSSILVEQPKASCQRPWEWCSYSLSPLLRRIWL